MKRITCRIHNLPAAGNDDGLLLCPTCLDDLPAAARHVADRYSSVLARWMRQYDAFLDLVRDSEWWAKVWEAKATQDPRFAEAWERARRGPNAPIIAAYEALDTTSAEVEQMNAWYIRAESELAAARAVAQEEVLV